MTPRLIIAAALSALALPAVAAPNETPYALSAAHDDFEAQLARLALRRDEIGAAAGTAATLMAAHNAAQERLVLPLLGRADTSASGAKAADLPDPAHLEAELLQLHDGDVDLVTALVELYALAEEAAEPEVARLAERMIWHQTGDVEVLYPAALLVEAALRARASEAQAVSGN